MNEEIRVHVADYGRTMLYMRYTDPFTGKAVAKSTGTSNRKEATKVAAVWEAELREGRYKSPLKVTWQEFTSRHQNEAQREMAIQTQNQYFVTFNSIDAEMSPKRLADMTASKIGEWQTKLRKRGLSENTVKSYSAHLKAALSWAKDVGLLHEAPKIRMPSRAKGGKVMKGRAVTAEEFDRMIEKTASIVTETHAAGWKRSLWGLWWSGLRLGEAVNLSWDVGGIRVEMIDGAAFLAIEADSQKSNEDQLLTLAPEFEEWLQAVPQDERTGHVFPFPMQRGQHRRIDTISRTITAIGKAAGVVVHRGKRLGTEYVKYASAHDLRRAFGTRWAPKMMPVDLQQLMRHADIKTTLGYYVTRDAQSLRDRIRECSGNTLRNTPQKETACDDGESAASR
ncbi:tyrosine-type recombinase/integrase [Planctomicrobium sp. SH664]|uniref:tyrosine-type recombinase/integrase n=1 Tax=Planctomicrobium sp. SH664 TaxID=3448125 RepID=UPI003F5B8B95